MPVTQNRYYNDPMLGQAFSNLAAMFAPPSGSDLAGYAEAAAKKDETERLARLTAYALSPNFDRSTFDRMGQAAGRWSPAAGYYGVDTQAATARANNDADNATTRRGQDITAETARATNSADNDRAIVEAAMSPVGVGETRFVPPAVALRLGVAPQQSGNVVLSPGERTYTADGRTLDGVMKPVSETEWLAQQGQRLVDKGALGDDALTAIIFGNTPLQTVQSPSGLRMVTTPQAIGAAPQSTTARPMTPDERASYGVPGNIGAYVDAAGKPGVLGSGGTTVNVGGSTPKLREALDTKQGQAWSDMLDAATLAGNSRNDLDMLAELSTMAPQGPVVGRLAQAFPGVSAAGDAFQSIVNRVAPTLRVPGSGSTSDIEYNGMLRSLPSLANQPEANRAIVGMMKAKADLNLRRGDVINAYQSGEIDDSEARRRLAEINKASILTPELQALLEKTARSDAAPDRSTAAPAATPMPQTQAEFDALPRGAIYRDPDDGKLYRKE